MCTILSQVVGRSIQYKEVKPPPSPAYEGLWAFLRAGGFEASNSVVKDITGRTPQTYEEAVTRALAGGREGT